MENYWLSLYPNTFIWIRLENGYVYNSENYSGGFFENKGSLVEKIALLENLDSLYRVLINEEELEEFYIKQFVNVVLQVKGGRLIQENDTQKPPISMKPEVRIQDDVNYYIWEHEQNIDGNIIHNLHKLEFYLNGSEYGSLKYCHQILYPLPITEELKIDKILNFIETGKVSGMFSEVCLIGNIWNYQQYNYLFKYLEEIGKTVIVYGVDKDMFSFLDDVKRLANKKRYFKIWITDFGRFGDTYMALKICKYVSYNFKVSSETEFKQVENLITFFNIQNFNIFPVYKDNLSFFKRQLFVDKDEIELMKLTKREIFIHQTLNIHSFGNFFIMPNGDVYANLNDEKIGTIEEPICGIIYREMTEGHSWFRIRNQKPCCDCIYQWLCPSPSNYELVIGRPNLCHIQNGE